MSTIQPKTWFITGASKGLGLTLARLLLALGHNVAATSRNRADLERAVAATADQFLLFLPLEADLTDEDSVGAAVELALKAFGRIDVVVNNAGYGLHGTVEALTDAELRRNFDVNVFAPLNVLRRTLPQLRRQRSGHVINIASIVGFQGGYAGWGSYVATKFALAGLTESMAAETRELGIKATVVYPGPVRTEFLSSGSLTLAQRHIDDYTEAQASLDLHLGTLAGNQAGDPDKLAELIVQAASVEKPPLHLFAGHISWDLAYQKIGEVKLDLAAWKDAALATDFPE
ncbi:SDR family oxidoreductase [Acerihabitans arboris]|uniref:SDR family NAD(P)-dependent oxidoreductase n=1 Tax=Acerihabitans arboris TaxID=2691583 RepID=A0A845SG78_9GAMM|nr:SDR family oxidoreductase [Acerihabitans arboris]NDL63860.1 SDR family NAD(P)-dependent oxidoreductase [Acerihabitans arboris]